MGRVEVVIGRPRLCGATHGGVRGLLALACAGAMAGALAVPAQAKVGGQAASFAAGPLVLQLALTFAGQQAVAGLPGRVLQRYVSDDGVLTVDLVVRGGVIEQQVMYLPADTHRAH